MSIKAVIFDLFKTLGELERLITEDEVTLLLRDKGYEVYPQAWRHAFSFVVFVDYPKEGYGTYEALFQQVFKRLRVDIDEDTLSELSNLFRNNSFVLYKESGEAIKRAKDSGLKIAIATSTPKPFFIKGISSVEEHIDFICTGYEAGYEKSNPQIFQRIMDELDITPEETIVIGDDPVLDISNPHRMGLRTIQIMLGEMAMQLADETAENVLEAVKITLRWV